jgi:hypothetical protein
LTLQESYDRFNQRLAMHNTLNPKKYTIMKSEAWQCLCKKCHMTLDKTNKNNITGKWEK